MISIYQDLICKNISVIAQKNQQLLIDVEFNNEKIISKNDDLNKSEYTGDVSFSKIIHLSLIGVDGNYLLKNVKLSATVTVPCKYGFNDITNQFTHASLCNDTATVPNQEITFLIDDAKIEDLEILSVLRNTNFSDFPNDILAETLVNYIAV